MLAKEDTQGVDSFLLKEGWVMIESDWILWGIRVFIPSKLQKRVLAELHQGHPGVIKNESPSQKSFLVVL